ncbi:MAG TPA: 2-oxo acid dehydrogenase subunit E2 [Paracoccus sp. (in: a-proteobacteria)]|uniref:2-oxo acid dehydrogenase subunit E2 n=1 Tax=Paracoccus sp. TaxID=267 RepID=UPI002C175958|nr:2-oxo acid dehydrogenase subunit E2 [Paracoccus sp. (in: a-proteobacteria)]HWL57527.1 2-oxo acid dehydrogenase subunit E2 [Paracoccus sp. (in: a-proteobacteria)]
MALHELRVPDIGDFKDVPVVEIPVKPGDLIAEGDTVLVLESDKATLDVPADRGGRVVALALKMADRVAKGTLVLTLEAEAEAAPPPPPAATAGPVPVAPEAAAPVAPSAPAEPLEQPSGIAADLPHASPSVRRMARALGVDLARVTGTGPKGRITSDDVNGFVRAALAAPAAAPAGEGLGLLPWPKVDYAAFGPVERQLLTRIARISGPSLQRNAVLIPHVTNFDEADITDLEAFRKAANAEGGAKLSILPFAVKAAVAALKRFPAFNASLDGDALVLKRYYNIGVAADTPDGLVVPVVRAADQKSLREIAAEMADLAADARAGRLKAPDMQGATFTISSLGGIGGINFTPIINAPEVAIMGMVRAQTRPLWDGAAFQPRLVQPLSLSWDHRVVDGVAAAKFLLAVKEILGDFRRISL